jgi:hypothetical protein
MSSNSLEILKMMDWFPLVFFPFKILALSIGMYFAIKWHYDKGQKEMDSRAVLLAGGKVAAVLVLSLLSLGLVTFFLAGRLGLNLNFP